jgi:aspartate/methionine/tyrosine aminotransferase
MQQLKRMNKIIQIILINQKYFSKLVIMFMKILRSNKVLINKPQGGFYLMPEFLNKKFNSSSEMCDSILNDTGVALLPGSDFGFEQTKMLARLSFH